MDEGGLRVGLLRFHGVCQISFTLNLGFFMGLESS
jgi:hypothetical protein